MIGEKEQITVNIYSSAEACLETCYETGCAKAKNKLSNWCLWWWYCLGKGQGN